MEDLGDVEGGGDGENNVTSKRKSSAKRNRISSSEEEVARSKNDIATPQSSRRGLRHSDRLEQKKKKVFSRPRRDKMWNAIESKDYAASHMALLKPRKLKFDYTKVTSRYNYDPAETSGEESDDSFVVSDNATSPSSSAERDKKDRPKKRQRVKRVKKRRIRENDTSDSDGDDLHVAEEKSNAPQQTLESSAQQNEGKQSSKEHPALVRNEKAALHSQCHVQAPDAVTKLRLLSTSDIGRKEDFPEYGYSTDTESDSGMVVPKAARGRRQILVSDSEESES